jgi:hypothetical protein
MSGDWISIGTPPCARTFAVSVASWAMAMARTMDSPRPWWSSRRVRSSRWKGSKRRWSHSQSQCHGGDAGQPPELRGRLLIQQGQVFKLKTKGPVAAQEVK